MNFFCSFLSVRLDHFISTIQLPDMIELDKYSRLQVHILHNEIRARVNDGNISSRKLNMISSMISSLVSLKRFITIW